MRWKEFREEETQPVWYLIGDAHARMISYPNAVRLATNEATSEEIVRQVQRVEPGNLALVSMGHMDLQKFIRPNIVRIGRRLEFVIRTLKEKDTQYIIGIVPPTGSENLAQNAMDYLRETLILTYENNDIKYLDLNDVSMSKGGVYANRGVYAAGIPRILQNIYNTTINPQEPNVPGNAPGQTDNIPQYPPGLSMSTIEQWITEECNLRGITPSVAIAVFRNEGYGNYQSTVTTGNQLKRYGREASYGPYQLYVGRGMGNDYERDTGRDLRTDNTNEGIRNQIRYALDKAATRGWGPWYGRIPAGVGKNDGIEGARAIRNWN